MSLLNRKYFHDEKAAFALLESILWPDGPICPHCDTRNNARTLKGKSTRLGLLKCYTCRKQFTVKVGTVFENARLPLYKMLQASYLLGSSKNGISIQELHVTLGITYKSAWFLAQRIGKALDKDKWPGDLDGATTVDGKEKVARPQASANERDPMVSMVEIDGKKYVKFEWPWTSADEREPMISLVEIDGKKYVRFTWPG